MDMAEQDGVAPWLKWLIIIQTSIVVLLLALFVILSITGTSFKKVTITSYDECVAAKGSIIQESYPARCITADEQTFIQPIETP